MIDLARARLILDLRGAMGINDEGIDVILHLVDQIYGLRCALLRASSTTVVSNVRRPDR
jgi:chaperone modulatory protein CbpM